LDHAVTLTEKKITPAVAQNPARVDSDRAADSHAGVDVPRAVAAARDSLLPRVEKLRKVSGIVLDETAYDPSLRFILIAVVLFVLFLVLLFLNKWVG
jgi:hypothetical protein